MSTLLNDNFSDIYNVELKLREKLAQLQFKEEALEQCQTQLTESKNYVCKLQILLENQRLTLNQVNSELRSAMELITQLEDEKIHRQIEHARLETNWRNAQTIQDNLICQARKTKLENVLLQRKNEILEANLSEQKVLNQVIAESVEDLRNQINQLLPTIQSNVEKLHQEQKYICNSFRTMTKLKNKITNKINIDCEQIHNDIKFNNEL